MIWTVMKTTVFYYITASGRKVVQEFIDSLEKAQQVKVLRIINTIESYGLLSVIPHLKKISGTHLWEIRILGKDNIRIFYVTLSRESILILHGFIKKKQKTDTREILIALAQLKEIYQTS